MKVINHIAGSICVIVKHNDWYIDAKKDVRYPNYAWLEKVVNGHVVKRDFLHYNKAPEKMLEWYRQ